MKIKKNYLIGASIIMLLVSPCFQAPVMAQSETGKVPSAFENLIGIVKRLGGFIDREKDISKRNLLVRRVNRLSDRVNILTVNVGNFRDSLDDANFDLDRALDNVAAIKGNLSEVNLVLNTIISDLNLQDQVAVTELEIRLRGITRRRGQRIRSIESELRNASSGNVNLQAIRGHAEQAHGLAQQLQREIATFLQNLRSNPVGQ